MPHQPALKITTPENDPLGADPIPIPPGAGAVGANYTVVAAGETAPLGNSIAVSEFRKNGVKVLAGKVAVEPRHWVVVFEGVFATAMDPTAKYSVFVKDAKGKQDENFFFFTQL
jgi:hypothetical protein